MMYTINHKQSMMYTINHKQSMMYTINHKQSLFMYKYDMMIVIFISL